jgi:EAL domain-containing protein (putative c-di-GMP-specific phosphodiesterase class I)
MEQDRVVAVAAVPHWASPRFGEIPPARFMSIAERSGLLPGMNAWVLSQVCRQALRWQALDLRMTVKVSTSQLTRPDAIDEILETLGDSGLPADRLELELGQTTLNMGEKALPESLAALRRAGVRLSIDRVGSGYLSLGALQRLGVERVKLDSSLLADLEQGGMAGDVARSIVRSAQRLDLSVVAEGVDTESLYRCLCEAGCDEAQGRVLATSALPGELDKALQASCQSSPRVESQSLIA